MPSQVVKTPDTTPSITNLAEVQSIVDGLSPSGQSSHSGYQSFLTTTSSLPSRILVGTSPQNILDDPKPHTVYTEYPAHGDDGKIEDDHVERLARILKQHDIEKVEMINADIDSLLILVSDLS